MKIYIAIIFVVLIAFIVIVLIRRDSDLTDSKSENSQNTESFNKKTIDEPEKLIEDSRALIKSKQWFEAKQKLTLLTNIYPNSSEIEDAKKLLSTVEKELGDNEMMTEEKLNQLKKELVGKKYVAPYSLTLIDKYGFPETKEGTDNKIWIAHFPKGNFTLFVNKTNDLITNVLP